MNYVPFPPSHVVEEANQKSTLIRLYGRLI